MSDNEEYEYEDEDEIDNDGDYYHEQYNTSTKSINHNPNSEFEKITYITEKDVIPSIIKDSEIVAETLETMKKYKLSTLESKLEYNTKDSECYICGAELKQKEMISLSCTHFFCLNCYIHQLTNKINDGEVIGLKCMEPSCYSHFNGDILKEILPISIYEKYTTFLTKQLIAEHPNYINCPNCDTCSTVIKCPEIANMDIHNDYICTCGVKFCKKCKHEDHKPATCSNTIEWNLLNEGDGMNYKWIEEHTKKCPNCNEPIEKNGGCNHMTCKSCSYDFCWICSEKWSTHRACNSFVSTEKQDAKKSLLQKYSHYWTRFNIHKQSEKFEESLLMKANEKARNMETNLYTASGVTIQNLETRYDNMLSSDGSPLNPSVSSDALLLSLSSYSQIDVKYIIEATCVLAKCRKFLKFSYVYSFYLSDENINEKNLFEYMQSQLERNTEELSDLLENNWTKRYEIINQTQAALKRLEKMSDGCITINPSNAISSIKPSSLTSTNKISANVNEVKRKVNSLINLNDNDYYHDIDFELSNQRNRSSDDENNEFMIDDDQINEVNPEDAFDQELQLAISASLQFK